MKKSLLILAAIIVSLIGVNAQQSLCEKNENSTVIEETSHDLYQSIVKDFENWYKDTTKEEMTIDEENQNLYNDLYESMELHKIVEAEINIDKENDKLYNSLKEDLEIFDVLSIAELKF